MKEVNMMEFKSPEKDTVIDRKARLLQSKVNDCNSEEQLKFFRNVVKHEVELQALKEIKAELKEASL